jgi:nucleotide-binding universal stress UspA family protein
MAKKVLVPVVPSERFYEAVLGAADILEDEGGLITFVFTTVRPPQSVYDSEVNGHAGDLDVALEVLDLDAEQLADWQRAQVAALEEARQLLYQHGIEDKQIDYLFADEADAEGAAQAIADEAAAGAYDAVVLARSYFTDEVQDPGDLSTSQDVAHAVQELEGVQLVVV